MPLTTGHSPLAILMFFWFSIILALVAAGTIAVVLWNRWKEIRLLDPDTIRMEQERKARDRIVRDRFERLMKRWGTPLRRSGKRLTYNISKSFQRMERRLRRTAGMTDDYIPSGTLKGDRSTKIQRMLGEANRLSGEGNAQKAERVYLEILKLDARHFDAYRGLGSLYLGARQYKQAKETFNFLVRIKGANDEVFAGLGAIAELEGDLGRAEDMRKRALSMNVRSPERHAEIANFYMKHGSPEDAWRHARSAYELNPESASALELSVESAILVRDQEEAEKRYEELRLMRYDRSKLQRLKEKLDVLTSTPS